MVAYCWVKRDVITQDEQREMLRLYTEEKLPTEKIGDLMGRAGKTIRTHLARMGAMRSLSDAFRRHSLNCDFFESINTEEKAYWLGFFSADGCVSRKNQMVLVLAWKDVGHVRAFQSSLDSSAPITPRRSSRLKATGRRYRMASITINSQKMASDLASVGVAPAKSKTLMPWNGPSYLLRHYYRGLLDGDGWISNRKSSTCSIGLVGSYPVVRGFRHYVTSHFHSNAKVRPHWRSKGIATIEFGGINLCQEIAHLLYDGAAFYLPRKKARADAILDRTPLLERRHDWTHLTLEYLHEMRGQLGTWAAVCRSIGIAWDSLKMVRRRLALK